MPARATRSPQWQPDWGWTVFRVGEVAATTRSMRTSRGGNHRCNPKVRGCSKDTQCDGSIYKGEARLFQKTKMTLTMFLSLAEFDRPQLLMLAGFVMLGWVLARRTISRRRRLARERRGADLAYKKLKNPTVHNVPLSDAPVDTQRWQVAMFDLQRELKADLDTRIAVVQTLLRQVDGRIAELKSLQSPSRDESTADRL